jgi:hypothetical protein
MDYLDPAKKKAHKRRIYIGYSLFAIAISFATLILGYLANGFYVDKSGDFIQNGLVFVDSKPNNAAVFLNGEKQQSKTDARLVIPSGSYTVNIKKAGYRDWNRSLTLEGGSLRRLTYARLVPEVLDTIGNINLRSQPIDASQSIDKRWIMLSHQDNPLALTVVDTEQTPISAETIVLPQAVVATSNGPGVLRFVEWSDNHNSLLVSYEADGQIQYILVDRENPSQSQNLTALLKAPKGTITLVDRHNDQFFVYQEDTKLLYTASIERGLSTAPVITTPLLAYQTFSNDWLLYVSESGDEGLVDVRFKRGDKDILLKQLKTSNSYLLELAKLGSSPIMAISSPVENRAVVYNDPQNYLNENPDSKIPVATTVLRVPSIVGLSISSDSSVVVGYSELRMASHEFDIDRSYVIDLDHPINIAIKPRWVDGQHLVYSGSGIQNMIDFDGSNNYSLLESISFLGSFYTNDIDQIVTFNPPVAATEATPAIPARLTFASLLTMEDR